MGILALYDTTSIQTYIFLSNRLRDNRGASLLVGDCFRKLLPEAIRAAGAVKHEQIYEGGGNALLHFENEEDYRRVNTEFSKLLLTRMPGLHVVTECMEETDSFGKDVDHLFKKLQLKKMRPQGLKDIPCLSVTRECSYTGKPALARDEFGRWISDEVQKKRERAAEEVDSREIKDMQELSGKDGSQWCAVVHIDGNGMGENIRHLLAGSSCEDGRKLIYDFSTKIKKLYDDTYEAMCLECRKLIDESTDSALSIYKDRLPFRKIYGAGDDLTFVCFAPLALKASEIFIRKMAELYKKMDFPECVQISACAGIAIMKPNFPFYRAYEIAEGCCKRAKVKARSYSRQSGKIGNYIDFHIVHGSIGDLSEIQKREYTVTEGDKDIYMQMRPYVVPMKVGEDRKNSLEIFYEISDFLKESPVARSKWKALRNAYYEGRKEAELSLKLIERRNKDQIEELEKLVTKREQGIHSPYIDANDTVVLGDALEMMDLYIKFREYKNEDEIKDNLGK